MRRVRTFSRNTQRWNANAPSRRRRDDLLAAVDLAESGMHHVGKHHERIDALERRFQLLTPPRAFGQRGARLQRRKARRAQVARNALAAEGAAHGLSAHVGLIVVRTECSDLHVGILARSAELTEHGEDRDTRSIGSRGHSKCSCWRQRVGQAQEKQHWESALRTSQSG